MAESQGGDVSSATRRSKGANVAKLAMVGATQEVAVTVPCGICKYLKKCTSECISALYLGSEQGAVSFAAVHKVFGASNVSKLLSNISINHRHKAAVTISYESQARLSDPVYGCVSNILALQLQVAAMQAEVSMMQFQLMNRRYAHASALQTTHQQQNQILQQPNFNVSVQPAYSNNSFASTNNFTAPSSHSLEPFQNSGMSQYEEDD